MNRLFLLRHAQAGWAQAGMRDHDRPLTASGRSDAEAMGRQMQTAGYLPDLVLCSTAVRAQQTWECVAPALTAGEPKVDYLEALYSTDAAGHVRLIREFADSAAALLLVGHNPMVEDLAIALPAGKGTATEAIASGFPTSGLAVLTFSGDWQSLGPGTGTLEAFVTPADL
ncbi:phosphohistidine phosphatase [Mesorhizobium sp. J18]|uniref:SixA phosphatase family protein n=1 Tax=Mesorhizobium sp. J18 TaxID=935263 RepID=UPI00119BB8AD|nr:histidine phosphatase family protein [Mesorhizobium sp. J18]TWG93827.1 phosphohistidine phosphatase [Mesorhizobium sp. J18]